MTNFSAGYVRELYASCVIHLHVAYGGYKAQCQTCHQYSGLTGNHYVDVHIAYMKS